MRPALGGRRGLSPFAALPKYVWNRLAGVDVVPDDDDGVDVAGGEQLAVAGPADDGDGVLVAAEIADASRGAGLVRRLGRRARLRSDVRHLRIDIPYLRMGRNLN